MGQMHGRNDWGNKRETQTDLRFKNVWEYKYGRTKQKQY